MKVTTKQIDKRIAKYGYGIHKTKGFAFFYVKEDAIIAKPLKNSSVMVNTLSQLTVDQWEQELLDKWLDTYSNIWMEIRSKNENQY
jgi:hypothetical protein